MYSGNLNAFTSTIENLSSFSNESAVESFQNAGVSMIGSLPFIDLNLHFQGVLRLEEDGIYLEWRRRMAFPLMMGWPLRKPATQQIHIPLNQLDAVEYKNPFYLFHAALHIRVRSMELLATVPGSNGVEVTLYCRKKYRHLAQEIANLATFRRLEQVFPERAAQHS